MTKDVTNDQIMTALTEFAGSVDKRFDAVDERFDRLEADVSELKTDVAELKTDVNRIYGILDAHMTRMERMMEENSVQTHQQERLQRWIFQLADEAGVRLKYE